MKEQRLQISRQVSVPFRGIKNRKVGSGKFTRRLLYFVSVPFRGIKNRKEVRRLKKLVGQSQFQSPFGELKIGKPSGVNSFPSSNFQFQSPFGELKIGKVEKSRDMGMSCFSPLSGN